MSDTSPGGTDRVHYSDARKFQGEVFETDGLKAEVEYVGTADDDPNDGEPRYTFDVHIRYTDADTDQEGEQ